VRDFDVLDWRRLAGAEGASTPFWSPDSRNVAFMAGDSLKTIETTGGPPATVASFPTAAAAGLSSKHGREHDSAVHS
jgi:hypothetical protein